MKQISYLLITMVLIACSANGSQGDTAPMGGSSPDGNGSTGRPTTVAKTGNWGGFGINLIVLADRSTYELDCAHGKISEALAGDANGNFQVHGTITLEHGGPTFPGEVLPTFNALYTGRFTKTDMSMRIDFVDENSQPVSTRYTLKQGVVGTLHKCL